MALDIKWKFIHIKPNCYVPLNTWRNNYVVITSKQRHFGVITSKWRRFDVITTSLLRNVSAVVIHSADYEARYEAKYIFSFFSYQKLFLLNKQYHLRRPMKSRKHS